MATAIRQGALSVIQLVRKPAPAEAPAVWPYHRRTGAPDYGQQEAAAAFGRDPRMYETVAKKLIAGKSGALSALEVSCAGRTKKLPCQMLLIAAGFSGAEDAPAEAFGLHLDERGRLGDADGRTANEKVFTAGDMRRGASLVAVAIAEGRRCAKVIDEYLEGYTNL